MSVGRSDCVVLGDVLFDVIVGKPTLNPIEIVKGGTSYCSLGSIDFGGSGNTASALTRMGMEVSFMGKAGKDTWGKLYEQELRSNGILTNLFFDEKTPTGLTITFLTPTGGRSFIVFRGANNSLTSSEIETAADLIRNSKNFYFSGYSLRTNPQRNAIIHAVKIARQHKVRIVFDPGAHNLIRSHRKLFNEIYEICDVFCPNLEEAKAMVNAKRLEDIASKLQREDKLVVIKLGRNGCMIIKDDEAMHVPAFRMKSIDTTGAGDAFAAGLIYGITKNIRLLSIGKIANWLAAKVTTKVGARNCPSKREIQSFIKQIENPNYG